MFRRMSLGSLFVMALLAHGICWGQGGHGYGPAGGPSGYPMPPQYAGAGLPPGGQRQTIYEELPDDKGWLFEDTPLEQFLEDRLRHAFFRAEYLLWSIGDPGDTLLSASPLSGANPRQPFPVNDPNTGALVGTATAPTLDGININNNNGFRGTFGMPFGPGAVEASAFVLANSTGVFNATGLITPGDLVGPPVISPTFVAQPVLQNGVQSDAVLLYTDSYEAVLKTGVWGTEANYVIAPPNASSGDSFTFSPMFGIRYLNFRETLRQHGVYQFTDDGGVTFSSVQRQIDASAINNLYGPQIGLRTELNAARFTIGAEPKIMLGLNTYNAAVATARILSPTESPFYNKQTDTTFGPVADLKVYTRFAMTQNLHLFASYNFMWAGMLTRPYENIVYNTSVLTNAGAFKQDVHYTDAIVQGLSVGAELRY